MLVDPQSQFGPAAEKYLTSAVHRDSPDFAWLIEHLKPCAEALDIATGAGHTAFALAEHCSRVVALDITPEMLEVVAREAESRSLGNLETCLGPAEELPFRAESFDIVTCRIAPHHFRDVPSFVSEVWRVLKAGGRFGLIDNIGSDDPIADEQLQDIERRRDPSHVRYVSYENWRRLLTDQGFEIVVEDTRFDMLVAADWLDRMSVAEPERSRLIDLIRYSEGALREYLIPDEEDGLRFRLFKGRFSSEKPLGN